MPPKPTQAPKKPRCKQPQNSRQVRRPARGGNENPCLNDDESQVGRPSEQTTDPTLVHDRLSPTMHEEEMYSSDEDSQYEEDGLEVERSLLPRDQHTPFLQPTHQQPLPEYGLPLGPPPSPLYQNHQQQLPVVQTHALYSMPRQSSNPLFQHRQPYQQLSAHQPQGGHMFQYSINAPPPPTVHGAERLSSRLCDDQWPMEYQQPPVRQAHPHYSMLGQSSNPLLQHQQPYQQLPAHQPQSGHMFQCSIDAPPPPTVRGAECLSGHLRDEQTRPMRSSPYPLPGLRKVSVFGPHHIDKGYRGQWQNTGVIYAGADKNVAPKRPMARDLPPIPLAPLDITVPDPQQPTPAHPLPTQSRDATYPCNDSSSSGPRQPTLPHSHPIQSSNTTHPYNDTGSLDPVPSQQQEPMPIPANLVNEICTSARSKMQCAALSDNGMPMNEENVAMAWAALSNAIATHASIPPG